MPLAPAELAASRALRPRVEAGGRVLLLADDPERVPGPGLLYADVVSGPFRVYVYGLADAPAPLQFHVLAVADGTQVVRVRVERQGVAGPGGGYFQVGRAAVEAWLGGGGRPATVAVAPGRPVPLCPDLAARRVPRGQVVNAIVDADAGGPVWIVVAAAAAGAAPVARPGVPALDPGPRPAGLPMRGTFPAADLVLRVSGCAPGRHLRLAHPAGYLTGFSAVDGRPVVNYGNYGVRYDVALSGDGSARSLLFVPLGGGFCGALAAGGRVIGLAEPGGRQLDAYHALHVGRFALGREGEAPWGFTWTPPAASYLPAAVAFA